MDETLMMTQMHYREYFCKYIRSQQEKRRDGFYYSYPFDYPLASLAA
jgi:hypothetical protein